LNAVVRSFPPDHPAAQGHFPGNPVIPGALLLSEVVHAIAADLGTHPGTVHIRAAKFLRPVRPGERVEIEFFRTGHGEVRFDCTVGGAPALTGQIRWNDMPAAG
jgi:3-hydroxymyristoyl/3-hydroxydecanoyl-(acyl carrier protein) dehydratase